MTRVGTHTWSTITHTWSTITHTWSTITHTWSTLNILKCNTQTMHTEVPYTTPVSYNFYAPAIKSTLSDLQLRTS